MLCNAKKKYPQIDIDGDQNIWIIKPSFSSRGIGVRCFKTIKEAFLKSKHIQAKIIQKYIENPFLLKLSISNNRTESRKFDIRQWVLVTSFNPLEVYMFRSCYLRICSHEYSLDNLKDECSHITNYAVQKKNGKTEELVMSLPQFLAYLKQNEYKYSFILKSSDTIWEEKIWPAMKKITVGTLLSVSEVIEHNPNCFELYGFDFLLDSNFHPWLLEVNLSPACHERTSWLTTMLGIHFL